LICGTDTLQVAVASGQEFFQKIMGPWIAPERVSFLAARRYTGNDFYHPREGDVELLSQPKSWSTIDYVTVNDPRVSGTAELLVERAGEGHGLLLWFDCETAPGLGFSNAPGARQNNAYPQQLFPWPEAVPLRAGDAVDVELYADPVGDDYVWRWNTVIRGADGSVRKRFRQSTFFSSPVWAETLPLRAETHRPAPNEEGAIASFVLTHMDGTSTLAEIAESLRGEFPQHFPNHKQAFDRAADVSVRYSRRRGQGDKPL
jgi:protein arginine N-methyltransferase 1